MPKVRDYKLINETKGLPCAICGSKFNIDAHHVTSRGAGGKDVLNNLMPLCRRHHTLLHTIGIYEAIRRYPKIVSWLKNKRRDDIFGKYEYLEICKRRK